MRWIWIDRFVEFHSGKSARAVQNLCRAEDHFADHFPGYPVMPASLILEGLAQTGGILVGEANQFREKVVLAKVPKAVFHREATACRVRSRRRVHAPAGASFVDDGEDGSSSSGRTVTRIRRPAARDHTNAPLPAVSSS